MSKCWSCSKEVPESSRFCPGCGSPVEASSADLTETVASPVVVAPADTGGAGAMPGGETAKEGVRPVDAGKGGAGTATSRTGEDDRLLPGTILGGRFRVFGLLGKGGMGEVYRADDLKLGQAVALKYLPRKLCTESMLARFYNEVRVARQVSHPNVCRMYDIFETDGRHFLSMEYIDGEDLASLLRRIGRLPTDKAVEIARQLCAGLAAAHDKGVIHRDLKPANVMIDGRGQVRITDFGLAGLAKEFAGKEIRSGTPAYMSPEQITGKGVSVQSDIYALGLALYEMFTGKRAFIADTAAEVGRLHQSATPTSPSEFIQDFDPTVERVLLRCLDKDPARRPRSALAVSAALPGGDPLAAVLAAGETPSPEMVAAAGTDGGVTAGAAACCLLPVLLGLVVVTLLSGRMTLFSYAPPEKRPVVLADRARSILSSLGYAEEPVARAHWIARSRGYLDYIARHDDTADRWEALKGGQPAVILFYYRESPVPFRPLNASGVVLPFDPPPLVRGMTNAALDGRGRLIGLRVVPANDPADEVPAGSADYAAVFAAADLDPTLFDRVDSDYSPPVHCDETAAWKGVYPERPTLPLRVEAGWRNGRCVYFEMVGPWRDRAGKTATATRSRGWADVPAVLRFGLQLVVLLGSALLARRNLRHGRGDRRGALRLALFVFASSVLRWMCMVHHESTPAGEWRLVQAMMGTALWGACFAWFLYMAVEPFLRRHWPETIITWSRLLAGRFRDPRVGRDILVGGLLAVVLVLLQQLQYFVPGWLSLPPPQPVSVFLGSLEGPGAFISHMLQSVPETVYMPMVFLLLILLLRVLLRRQWAAVAGVIALAMMLYPLSVRTDLLWIDTTVRTLSGVVVVAALFRFGVLAVVFQMFFQELLTDYPLPVDFSAWYAWVGTLAVGTVAAFCVYGFVVSLGGRALFESPMLET